MANASGSKTTPEGGSKANSSGGQKKTLASKTTKTRKTSTGKSSSKTKQVVQISGNIEVVTGSVEVDAPEGVIETPDFIMDEHGKCFSRSALTLDINGRPRIVSLNAKETQYFLRLVRAV